MGARATATEEFIRMHGVLTVLRLNMFLEPLEAAGAHWPTVPAVEPSSTSRRRDNSAAQQEQYPSAAHPPQSHRLPQPKSSAVCGTTCTRVISPPAPMPHAGSSSDPLLSSACSLTISRSSSGATPRSSPIARPSRFTVQPSETPPNIAVVPVTSPAPP